MRSSSTTRCFLVPATNCATKKPALVVVACLVMVSPRAARIRMAAAAAITRTRIRVRWAGLVTTVDLKGSVLMAMRGGKGEKPTTKVRKTWRCPKCGHKIETVECYGCLIEAERKAQAQRNREDAYRYLAAGSGPEEFEEAC